MPALRNKKVLITAGPTQVAIDKVRVISNIATGQTGILLAEKFKKAGAKVTLLLGSQESCCLSRGIRFIPFRFFDELNNTLKRELRKTNYDILIHAAAVSDYRPRISYPGKIKSGITSLTIKLRPTVKIINAVRKIRPRIFLVGFKFIPQAEKESLLSGARKLIKTAKADLAVANTVKGKSYQAYILNGNVASGKIIDKEEMASKLMNMIGARLCRN